MGESDATAKKHDLEERPRDTARRLIGNDVRKVSERMQSLRSRVFRHVRFLSDKDREELVKFLEDEFEQTRTVAEGVGEPTREFSFSSELLDRAEIE